MTAAILTPQQIQDRINNPQPLAPVPDTVPPRVWKFYRPLAEAADEYIGWARTPGERLYLGISEFDEAMRGTAPGEMTIAVGFAHSGKTVLVTQLIYNNRDRRLIMFSPDETRVLILVKLTSLVTGMSADELEERIATGDTDAEQLVRNTALNEFPNLAVFDDSLTLDQMATAVNETEEAWGNTCEGVIYDYLELLPGDGDVPGKFNAIKGWGKRMRVPLWVLHQSSRSRGADGAQVTISSGSYGGEQQATHLIGVRRKAKEAEARIRELRDKIRTQSKPGEHLYEQLQEAEYDLETHRNTVTFNLLKNKRPPSRLVDDMDFTLDWRTGAIRPFNMRTDTGRTTTAGAAAAQRRFDGGEDEPF